ncbi:aminotransferase DegT, partial [Candidatus Desantisbacteria bacterium CG07_land_8_20_14_0_80_39_15]
MEKLAIDGGRPVRKKPFPPRLLIGKEEKRAILKMVNRTLLHGGAFER